MSAKTDTGSPAKLASDKFYLKQSETKTIANINSIFTQPEREMVFDALAILLNACFAFEDKKIRQIKALAQRFKIDATELD